MEAGNLYGLQFWFLLLLSLAQSLRQRRLKQVQPARIPGSKWGLLQSQPRSISLPLSDLASTATPAQSTAYSRPRMSLKSGQT
jgi:hypothetical protein